MDENKLETQKTTEAVESATIGKLVMALAKAQGQIKAAPKDSTNPFFDSKYSDLASVWDVCRDPLAKNGLAVIQRPNPTDGSTVSLTTILAHESGEWIRGTLIMRPGKTDPQGIGSCLTYARRYALAAMVGICSEADDDGNKATGKGKAPDAGKAYPQSEAQPGILVTKIKELAPTNSPKFFTLITTEGQKMGVGDPDLITIANEVIKTGEDVRLHFEVDGRFTDVTDIERRKAPAAPPPAPAPAPAPASPPAAAAKHNPHQMAPMAPSAGNVMAVGLIETKSKPNELGHIAWTIQGQQRDDGKDMKFASKDPEIIKKMDLIMEAKAKVKLEYKPATNPRFAHVIVDARPEADLDEILF